MSESIKKLQALCAGKRIALLGMGISNRAACDLLLAAGATLTARDKNSEPSEDLLRFLAERHIEGRFGEGYLDDLTEDILLRSPGIRPDLPALQKAKEKGAVISSEMALFLACCPAKLYAVTGSDGKTTTTTLIAKMLEKAAEREGARVFLGGNIGTPLLPYLSEMTENDYAVLELSSFQLFDLLCKPLAAVVTNVTPNHLNWHIDMDEYVAAKKNIFALQDVHCRLVLNAENDITCGMANEAKARVTRFSSQKQPSGTACYLENGVICYSEKGEREVIMTREDILLPGVHNVENYMAAVSAVHGVVTAEEMWEVARTFGGVSHRLELVLERDGVKYYNSSIDTSPTRTLAALSAFCEKLIVIVGGYDKHIPMEPLIGSLAEKAKAVVATGDTGLHVLSLLKATGYPKEQMAYLGNFDDAVEHAKSIAKAGDTVLLSPAAASFDSFQNFEKRGERFRALVRNNK